MQVTVVDHPLVALRTTTIRDAETGRAGFREAARALSRYVVYEALRGLPTRAVSVETPVATTRGAELHAEPLVVPVLRAGLGMLDAALEILPEARVGFVGVARDEETHEAHSYLTSLPEDLSGRTVLVIDPMLATGGSMLFTLREVFARGADDVVVACLVAAPEGVRALEASGLAVRLVTAALDDGLDAHAFIVPGLGDAGDRLFGPR